MKKSKKEKYRKKGKKIRESKIFHKLEPGMETTKLKGKKIYMPGGWEKDKPKGKRGGFQIVETEDKKKAKNILDLLKGEK